MKKPGRRKKEGISYWESMADAIVGLLLYVLLIVILLILLLLQSPRDENIDMFMGDTTNKMKGWDDLGADINEEDRGFVDEDESELEGDGGEAEEEEEEEGEGDSEENSSGGAGLIDPDPGSGEGDGSDKAAVLVQVVDDETRRTIKKAGIEFELYNSAEALQILSTYYPVKTDYKKYETDKNGVFYLPEKIPTGSYYLHGLTGIEGYEVPERTELRPDHAFEWDEPYTVQVLVTPAKNIIRIQLNEQGTKNGISGASFHVIAAEDIVTRDGTTRCKQGEIADTIVVKGNGYGESKPLFIGKYLLRQEDVPEYYGAILEDTPAQVESESVSGTPPVIDLKEQKTTMRITLTDALYEERTIAGAVFEVTSEGGEPVRSVTTNKNGTCVLTDLRKGITYHVRQISTVSPYQLDTADHEFSITARGLIEENVVGNMKVKNRIIRATFSVRDKLFKGPVSDVNIALLDRNNSVVQKWDTTATDKLIEGLTPGEYHVVIGGDTANMHIVRVEDRTDLQAFSFTKWTVADFGAIFVAALLAVGLIVSIIFATIRHIEKRKEKGGISADGE